MIFEKFELPEIPLRDYQQRAIDFLARSIGTGHKAPVLVASTGSGKTRTAAAICRRAIAKGNHVLFITPRRGLTIQANEAFDELGIESGIIMAGIEHDNRHRVEVASMDTIISRLGKDRLTSALLGVEAADILIIDEAHLAVSDKRKEFLLSVLEGKYGPKKIIIGLTASPCVAGGGGLGAVFDDLLVPVTMHELIEQGYLCRPRYYAAERPDLSKVGDSGGDYKQGELGDAYADTTIMGDVITNWQRIAAGTTTVVFTPTRANAADLVGRFDAVGVKAEYVDANTTDRDRGQMYHRVKAGKTTVICNVGIVSLGVDIPNIQTVVMATATKSIAKWMQAVGRALRPSEGKEFAHIIDHGGMSLDPKMGPVEDIVDWTLDEKSKVQDRIQQRKEANREPKEITCSNCKTVFKARHSCPACGFAMKQKTEALEYYEADLKEVVREGNKANRKTGWDEKKQFMGELKMYAMEKGYKQGWVAHQYRSKFLVWPNDARVKNSPPVPVTDLVRGWIKHQAIKRAKSKAVA